MSYRVINAVMVECDGPECTEAITVPHPSDIEQFGWRIGAGAYRHYCHVCVEHMNPSELQEPANA